MTEMGNDMIKKLFDPGSVNPYEPGQPFGRTIPGSVTTAPVTSAETNVVSLDSATTLEPVSRTPVLITEQEVVFATAAAAVVPPGTTHRHRLGTFVSAFGRIHIRLPAPRPIYPRREASYFESARMSRLMDHL